MANQIPSIPYGLNGVDLVNVLNDRLRRINLALGQSTDVGVSTSAVSYGLHKLRLGRPIAQFDDGAFFSETDRDALYQKQNGVWAYAGGVMRATFAARPTDLAVNDAGFLWSVTDYGHLLRWTGTGWEFEDGAGNYIVGSAAAPDGNGWQYCDGTATTYLHISGGVVSAAAFTTPNLTGGGYLKWAAAYTGSLVAANAPSVASTVVAGTGALTGAKTLNADGEPSHLVVLPYYRR